MTRAELAVCVANVGESSSEVLTGRPDERTRIDGIGAVTGWEELDAIKGGKRIRKREEAEEGRGETRGLLSRGRSKGRF